MKKIEYQAPEMEIMELKLQGILCVSPSLDEGDIDTGGITPGGGNTPTPGQSF